MMKAGDKVIMEFSDGTSGPVPVRDIALYKKQAESMGGWARVKGTGSGMMGQVMPHQIATSLADWAPTVGAVGGSIVGGVLGGGAAAGAGPAAPAVAPYTAATGRVAGGIAGGVLGKAAQEAVYRQQGYVDAPGTVAGEAGAQAILGPVGEGLGVVSQGLGRTALGASIMAKGKEGARAIEEMILTRTPVGGPNLGRLLESGGAKATRLWRGATAARNRVNAEAGQQGVEVPVSAATDRIKDLIFKASDEMADESEIKYLKSRFMSWKNRNLQFMSPERAQRILSRLDAKSKPIFEAMNRKGQTPPSNAMVAKANYQREVADALREFMQGPNGVPGHKETSKALGNAIAMKNAILQAEALPSLQRFGLRTGAGTAVGGVAGAALDSGDRWRGGRIGGAIGATAMNAPQATSRLGLALTDPLTYQLLAQTPRFVMGGDK